MGGQIGSVLDVPTVVRIAEVPCQHAYMPRATLRAVRGEGDIYLQCIDVLDDIWAMIR